MDVFVVKPSDLLKSKYMKKWRGSDGKWRYQYKDVVATPGKKSDRTTKLESGPGAGGSKPSKKGSEGDMPPAIKRGVDAMESVGLKPYSMPSSQFNAKWAEYKTKMSTLRTSSSGVKTTSSIDNMSERQHIQYMKEDLSPTERKYAALSYYSKTNFGFPSGSKKKKKRR